MYPDDLIIGKLYYIKENGRSNYWEVLDVYTKEDSGDYTIVSMREHDNGKAWKTSDIYVSNEDLEWEEYIPKRNKPKENIS